MQEGFGREPVGKFRRATQVAVPQRRRDLFAVAAPNFWVGTILLFTVISNQFTSFNMNSEMANLPVTIFQFANSPYDNWVSLAWGGAMLSRLPVGLSCARL